MSVIDVLTERGFIRQFTHEHELRQLLEKEKVTFYTGFDPTADSLHVGGFLQLMAMSHMQMAGHRPIVLIGGGTGLIGDPSGKTDMRQLLTADRVEHNCRCLKKQMERFLDFSDGKAIMVNNADWLMQLNYVEVLREIGVHFSVNRMLSAECFRQRWERGLSFLEFNYMLMQAYDFLELNRRYNCVLQMGGDDQWSNIIAGVELIRRKLQRPAYGLTLTLLTTSAGVKMGKTVSGAVWLDAAKTSPYEFYQYWRNVEDESVGRCLSLLTFLPTDEVARLSRLRDRGINLAKEILAYEVTKAVHGIQAADSAQNAARALFAGQGSVDNAPTVCIAGESLGKKLPDVLVAAGILKSKTEARRAI
ncbi:MAG: tyrosine--tRNA ligase, partial [Negativicutes bacterium]|nr:tyrosine--tRNA ligase [Negativicutes bacterium]